MTRDARRGFALVFTVWIGLAMVPCSDSTGADPDCSSLWGFLGISQKDCAGRAAPQPPLKAIADPANLESDGPVIKSGPLIKKAEDLVPQKIKAIRYLAGLGRESGSQRAAVRKALAAALDDGSDDVRYEAAIAVGQLVDEHGQRILCEEMLGRLEQMTGGKDGHGRPLEPSPRVRAAARNALEAQRRDRVPNSDRGRLLR